MILTKEALANLARKTKRMRKQKKTRTRKARIQKAKTRIKYLLHAQETNGCGQDTSLARTVTKNLMSRRIIRVVVYGTQVRS